MFLCQKENYKYLGILKADTINQRKSKKRLTQKNKQNIWK